jgi:aminobenzoyl-glutamate utilization protein B
LNESKRKISEYIDHHKAYFAQLSDQIWTFSETRFEEVRSARLLCDALEKEGFRIEKGIGQMPTAFVGSYGSGSPVIGILAEYDALSGLSQKAGQGSKTPIEEGGNGHGCGHNLLGTGSLAAALAIKKHLQENDLQGTIRLYGCPAEEGGSGKVYMVRAGVFDDVDIALSWHPFAQNAVWSVSSLANYQVYFRFHGKSSHAAASPHLGRSALDAVELMNVGVNYMREHVVPEARIHYAVTNTGGKAPNVVQAEAEVLYLMRAPELGQVKDIYERVCDIAKGAALMTQTQCEVVFDKACSNLILNDTLNGVLYDNLKMTGPAEISDADRAYAQKIRNTFSESDLSTEENMVKMYTPRQGPECARLLRGKALSDQVLPYEGVAGVLPGSTDVGDVSWVVPTAQIITSCYALGTPGHSWQLTDQGKLDYAHKGMLTAAKAIAMTALDIFESPQLVEEAKTELDNRLDGTTYICPIPEDILPAKNRSGQ